MSTLVFAVCSISALTSQAGTWTPLVHQPTFLNPPSQCALYPNANCAPPDNYSYGGVSNANLLTDGSVLVEAVAVDDNDNVSWVEYKLTEAPPTKFFEFDGRKLVPQPDIPDSAIDGGAFFLELPTGQILEFDGNTDLEIYTPDFDREHRPWYAPFIFEVPWEVEPGKSYHLKGFLLNGVSQGAMEGDDYQMATNYPLVRITNLETHHVVYSRTYDFSSMAVANPDPVSARFEVPRSQEKGWSLLEVVTNGVASEAVEILVK